MNKFPKFFGLATIGAKGQVVVPKDARRALSLKAGDKLIVISGHGGKKMLVFVAADDFAQHLSQFERHISVLKQEISKKGK